MFIKCVISDVKNKLLHVEKPMEAKYRKGYSISKCYCMLCLPGAENKGYVWLRRMACFHEDCEECAAGEFLDCKDPGGCCGPWIKCRLIHGHQNRQRMPVAGSKGLGPKISVFDTVFVKIELSNLRCV